MARRRSAIGESQVDADGGRIPNQYQPFVSAHFRVYWPPLATGEEIEQAIDAALAELYEAVRTRQEGKR
jgi:hypothetical protein